MTYKLQFWRQYRGTKRQLRRAREVAIFYIKLREGAEIRARDATLIATEAAERELIEGSNAPKKSRQAAYEQGIRDALANPARERQRLRSGARIDPSMHPA